MRLLEARRLKVTGPPRAQRNRKNDERHAQSGGGREEG
jgi:hypothetical protein